MPYVPPDEVVSPKSSWTLVDVVLDRGEGDCAYAIGMWRNGRRRRRHVGFRWNGSDESPLGNPQSRGLPTWLMLDPALTDSIIDLVDSENPEKAPILRAFLGRPVE